MKTIYLENRGTQDGAECNKFFRLTDDGHKVIAEWGSIGQVRPPKILCESEDPEVRQKAWDKKLKEKTKRKDNPYQIITSTGVEASRPVVQHEERPSSEGRKFGLEVETHSQLNISDVIEKLEARGLEINDQRSRYFHSNGQKWDVKRDGSCGYEFASPIISGEAGIFDSKLAVEKIREVCDTAVNRKCGLHVTIDVSDHSEEELIRFAIAYLKAQDHFYAECADYRATNHFCKKNSTHRMEQMLRCRSVSEVLAMANGNDRYHGMNFTRTLVAPRVIEFRMMESTVQMRKVGAWIRMCVGFVDGVKKSGVRFKTTEKISKETFDQICASQWQIK